jgi:AcrR family transcriptional regulator
LKASHTRTPKQKRSRESFDRVIAATIELLREGGDSALTLSAVSRRAKVSIGSIYCRVDGKDALVREVQSVVIHQMEHEFALLINRVRRRQLPLPELVPALIREIAQYLRRNANVLHAFMQLGDRDTVVEDVGRRAYQQNLLDFKLLLLERASEFRHPDPERAAESCFSVAYAALARYLGLNSGPGHGGAGEGDWRQLVEDLGTMSLAFMLFDMGKDVRAREMASAGAPAPDVGSHAHSPADTVLASRPWSGKGM